MLPVGAMCGPAMQAAQRLAADGLDVSVVNCRFVKPVDGAMLETLVRDHRFLVTIEDGVVTNGFGAYLAEIVRSLAPEVRVLALQPGGVLERRQCRRNSVEVCHAAAEAQFLPRGRDNPAIALIGQFR